MLRILKGQHPEPVSINSITDRMIDKMSNASRLVDKLFAKNLIDRIPCTYDKRQVDVSINTLGISELTKMSTNVAEVINSHSHISEKEYQTLNSILDKLRKD